MIYEFLDVLFHNESLMYAVICSFYLSNDLWVNSYLLWTRVFFRIICRTSYDIIIEFWQAAHSSPNGTGHLSIDIFIWSIQIKFDPQRRETKVEKERKSSEKIEKQEGKGTGSRCIGRNAASVAQGEPLRAAP